MGPLSLIHTKSFSPPPGLNIFEGVEEGEKPKKDQTMNFEQFLNFILTYQQIARDFHPYWGYPLDFALRVKSAMKNKGAVPLGEMVDLMRPRGGSKELPEDGPGG